MKGFKLTFDMSAVLRRIFWNLVCCYLCITAHKMDNNPNYDIILSDATLQMIKTYKTDLLSNTTKPGANLAKILEDEQIDLEKTSNERFIELLLLTKKPLIFAESEIEGDGSDWNADELRILGDISIAMNVEIYDNGIWNPRDSHFQKYDRPMNGTLLFTPGPLLHFRMRKTTPDLQEIIENDDINQNKYNQLIDRRIAPLLYYINENAAKENVCAIVTIPGIGAGQFAGRFKGTMGNRLNVAFQSVLAKHMGQYKHIGCIYFDPFSECTNEEQQFENIKYRVRPATKNPGKSLLSEPKVYEEPGDDFSNCKLFKVVAWDHVSFPGNDYFGGGRFTDDGVSAAATNSMKIITGIDGTYENGKYLPPNKNDIWEDVVNKENITLIANAQNIRVIDI